MKMETPHNLYKTLSVFQKENNISDRKMMSLLVREACRYREQSEIDNNKDWDESLKEKEEQFKSQCKPTYDILWELYMKLEQEVANFLIEHPDVIKNLQEIRDSQLDTKRVSPIVGFGFGFDDVFERLKKGMPGGMDMYCGFNIGNKQVSIC